MQGVGRSIHGAYRDIKGLSKGNASGRWCTWSKDWNWLKRAEAWDDDQIARRRQIQKEEGDRAYREKLRKYHEKLERVANLLIDVAEDGLEKLRQAVREIEPSEFDSDRVGANVKSLGDAVDKGGLMLERALGVEDVARGLDELSAEKEDSGNGSIA